MKMSEAARQLATEVLEGKVIPVAFGSHWDPLTGAFISNDTRDKEFPACAGHIVAARAGRSDDGMYILGNAAYALTIVRAANDVDVNDPGRPHNLYMALESYADALEQEGR